MKVRVFASRRVLLTAIVAVLAMLHLLWEHFHGGVASHHLLNRADLPSISNYWGLLLLPLMTWFVIGRVDRRLTAKGGQGVGQVNAMRRVVVAFLLSMLAGVSLSFAFMHGFEDMAFYTLLGVLFAGLILPVYRAECILGFVIGMTFTFGAILPSLVATVVASTSALLHGLLYPLIRAAWQWLSTSRAQ